MTRIKAVLLLIIIYLFISFCDDMYNMSTFFLLIKYYSYFSFLNIVQSFKGIYTGMWPYIYHQHVNICG